MRYLVKFNETLSEDKTQEIQEFCNDNLVDLLDIGYNIVIDGKINQSYYTIIIRHNKFDIMWYEIKDYVIPFFEFLNDKYEIREYGYDEFHQSPEYLFVPDNTGFHKQYYTLEQVLEDKIPGNRTFKRFIICLLK